MKKIIPNDAVLIPDQAERVFAGAIYDVYQWPQQLFDGSTETFEMLKRADTVSVICIIDEALLVLDEEQPHSGSRQSFPGGRVDSSDSTILTAAQREVQEETGYSFQQWQLIGVRQPHTKIEWFVYTFLAWEPGRQQTAKLDAGEKIHLQTLPFDEVKRLVSDKVGYLGEADRFFANSHNAQDLLRLPAFVGQTVDR